MILLISQNNSEHTTNDVTDWLFHYEATYKRLNGIDALFAFDYHIDQTDDSYISRINGDGHSLDKLTIWFRRWLPSEFYYVEGGVTALESLNRQITDYLKQEGSELRPYFLGKLKYRNILTDFSKTNINKIEILNKAKNVGLTIPDTLITSSKGSLLKFKVKHKNIIVKNIKDAGFFAVNDKYYVSFTALLTDKDFYHLTECFFPSLFQEAIEKLYEIRCFYLDGEIYSMAIFSQGNKKTEVDFRNYDYQKPNRNIPYILPDEIKDKIIALMKNVGLNCGSIDFLYSTNNDYVFLEINPVGQFGFVSYTCNYNLESKVAKWLINHDQ